MLDYMERHDVCDDNGNVLYNVTAVQQMHTPTWFAASDTATVTKARRRQVTEARRRQMTKV